MATSSTFNTSNGNLKYNIEVIQNSQSVSGNTSNITVRVRFWKTYNADTWGNGTVYCKIDGTQHSSSISNTQVITVNGITLFDKTVNVSHNSDGSKNVYVSAWATHDRFSSSEQGFEVNLSTIPRASSISLSSSNVNAGSQINVTINSPNSGFRHDYHLVFGSSPNNVFGFGKGVAGGTYTVTIPNDTMNKIPSATSGYGTIYCDTYSGSTHLGTSSAGITVNVPGGINPTIGSLLFERLDNGLVPPSWGVYVKGKSKARIKIYDAFGTYGSWLTSSSISGFGATWSGSDITTGEIWATGTQTITATVYDSRGRSTSKSDTITVYDYWNPSINSCNVIRCTSNGTASEDGTYAKVTMNYVFASVNGKNTCNGKVWFRKKGDTAWSAEIPLSNNTAKVIGGSMSTDYSYEIFFRAQDAMSYTDITIEMPSAKVTMDFRAGGNGIAVGKVAEKDGLEIDWPTWLNKGFTVTGNTQFNGNLAINGNIQPGNDNGIYWNSNGDGADIMFHADNPSGASYLKYNVRDDHDEYHTFGGTHWSSGWQEWFKITSGGCYIKGSTVLNNGICKNTFTDTTANWKEGYVQLDSTNRLFYGWLTMNNTSSGWQMRTYAVPGATELYGGTLITSRPAVSIVREISGASFVCQLYEMDANETSIRVRYVMVGR